MTKQTTIAHVGPPNGSGQAPIQASTVRIWTGILTIVVTFFTAVAVGSLWVGRVESHMRDTLVHETPEAKAQRIDERIAHSITVSGLVPPPWFRQTVERNTATLQQIASDLSVMRERIARLEQRLSGGSP